MYAFDDDDDDTFRSDKKPIKSLYSGNYHEEASGRDQSGDWSKERWLDRKVIESSSTKYHQSTAHRSSDPPSYQERDTEGSHRERKRSDVYEESYKLSDVRRRDSGGQQRDQVGDVEEDEGRFREHARPVRRRSPSPAPTSDWDSRSDHSTPLSSPRRFDSPEVSSRVDRSKDTHRAHGSPVSYHRRSRSKERGHTASHRATERGKPSRRSHSPPPRREHRSPSVTDRRAFAAKRSPSSDAEPTKRHSDSQKRRHRDNYPIRSPSPKRSRRRSSERERRSSHGGDRDQREDKDKDRDRDRKRRTDKYNYEEKAKDRERERERDKRRKHTERDDRHDRRARKEERRSVLTGKKIKLKVHKDAADIDRDAKRENLLNFLNSAYD